MENTGLILTLIAIVYFGAILLAIFIGMVYLIIKIQEVMASNAEIKAKVDELQQALDAEQAQIATAIDTLQGTVNDLKAQVADAGTPEERQAIVDEIQNVISDLKSTVPDEQPPTEPESGTEQGV